MPYAELHALSHFSFQRGASSARELIERARQLGYRALAVTDECSLAGIVRAHEAARELAFPLIVGSELRLQCGMRLVLLCSDHRGYTTLCELITTARRAADKGSYRLTRADFPGHCPGLLALWLDADQGDSPLPAGPATPAPDAVRIADAAWLSEHFPDGVWIAVELHRTPADARRLLRLRALSGATGLPLVATGDVHMHSRGRRALQDVLTAIRHHQTLREAGYRLLPNGERHLRPLAALRRLYPPELLEESVRIAERCRFSLDQLRYEYPRELVPAGSTATGHLRRLTEEGLLRRWPTGTPAAVRAQIERELALIAELRFESYFLTVHDIVAFARSQQILCQGRGSAANSAVCYALGITEVDPARGNLLFERFISRERNEPPDIDVDFEHERREEVIQYIYGKYGRERAALAATVISYRPKSAIRDVGKALGLALDQVEEIAGSLAWWDGESAIGERLAERGFDPASPPMKKLLVLVSELLGFPRHLSQHVGGFVISEHPLSQLVPVENAAMPDRTIIQWDKDDLDTLGLLKVDCLALGMLSCIRRCLDLVNGWAVFERERSSGNTQERGWGLGAGAQVRHGEASSKDREQSERRGWGLGAGAQVRADRASPSHREKNKSAPPEGALPEPSNHLDPSNGAPQPPAPSPAFLDAPSPAFLDAPSPALLDAPSPAFHPLTLGSIPPEDSATYQMLQRGDSVGVFQVESRAQMAMLPRLKPENFYDLVIEVAIVRPGPIQGKMVHPYLRRRQGLEPVSYPSEDLRRVFERTLGVPIFQEQVMQLAIVAAGFTPGEADELRRSMAAWKRRGGLAHYRQRIIEGMAERGYEVGFAEQVFEQIKGFGSYGFPESHAASFALLVYASAWLKCHHPAAFAAALINAQPLGFYSVDQIVQDARRHRVEVRPVDVRHSRVDAHLEPGKRGPALRLGLRTIRGLPAEASERIVAARGDQPYTDVEDLARRAALERPTLRTLAEAGALRGLAGHRHRAHWAAAAVDAPTPLLGEARIADDPVTLRPPDAAENVLADYATLGLTLEAHPLRLLRARLRAAGWRSVSDALAATHGTPMRSAGLVRLRQRPGTASGVMFLTLEDESGWLNVIVWPKLVETQRRELLESQMLGVIGELQTAEGVTHLLARRLVDLSDWLGGLDARSRDFH